jgi:hypothetical protein
MAKLQCKVCGGKLVMAPNNEYSECENCGTQYTAESMKNMLTEITGTVRVDGEVKVAGVSDADRLSQNGETFFKLKEWYKAYCVFTEMTTKFPEDHRGWRGIILAKTGCFTFNPYLPTEREYANAYNTATETQRATLKDEVGLLKQNWKAKINKLYDGTLPKEKNQEPIYYTKSPPNNVGGYICWHNPEALCLYRKGPCCRLLNSHGRIKIGAAYFAWLKINERGIVTYDNNQGFLLNFTNQTTGRILAYISDDFQELMFNRGEVLTTGRFISYKTDFKQIVEDARFFEQVFDR